MFEPTAPDVVRTLVAIISGDLPLSTAEACLHPQVRIHMDRANHHGIVIWYKWIHLIRHCGRVRDLKMNPVTLEPDDRDPQIVCLTVRWSGTSRVQLARVSSPAVATLRYRVEQGRIVEIWSHKSNYIFIFGSWIRYSLGYRLFLGWAIFYFALRSLRESDVRVWGYMG